jgi:hypothetical protein
MLKKRQLFSSLLLILLISACSTNKFPPIPPENPSLRAIASSERALVFQDFASFDLKEIKGSTYTHFMKTKVKPALDKFSDAKNGGGGGFYNVGADTYLAQTPLLDAKTFKGYKGTKWNHTKKAYEGGLTDDQVMSVYSSLKKIKPISTVDSLSYFSRDDKSWFQKNDMALALKDAKINAAPFDLATLYALTSGIGVKVKIDDLNYNYHVLYKTGKTKPHEEVMSGRSFASAPTHGASDATDPEYLKDLKKYLESASDLKPFYRAMMLALADSDTSGWATLPDLGQSVLSDFLTVYTAEADRHLMVNLQDGNHPWEIDLAAVTVVSAVSTKTGKVVFGGALIESDLGGWFAPSPHNKPDGPQRSGIGITRKDRQKLQRAIHAYEMGTPDGKQIIADIQAIIGTKFNKNDVIQGVFEFLSNPYTPASLGPKAAVLADLMARLVEASSNDAHEILKLVPSV